MRSETRTIVTFKSAAFNVVEPKSYFINPRCFGDDLARWFIRELRNRGLDTDDEPAQGDFGWHLNFNVPGGSHTFFVAHRPGSEGKAAMWIGWPKRDVGFFGFLFGGRKRGIDPLAAEALHKVLSESPLIQDVRWHFHGDFDDDEEQLGAATPCMGHSGRI